MLFQQINVQTKAAYIEQKSFKVTATNVIKNQTNVNEGRIQCNFREQFVCHSLALR